MESEAQISTMVDAALRRKLDISMAERGKKLKEAIAEAVALWLEAGKNNGYLSDLWADAAKPG